MTTAYYGQISTPGYPKNVSETTRCVWIITLPPPADNTSVSILKFNLYEERRMANNDPSM